jgi:hypothetical protein
MTSKQLTYISIRIVLLSLFIALQLVSTGMAQESNDETEDAAQANVANDSKKADGIQ